jgi:hypothetical protein
LGALGWVQSGRVDTLYQQWFITPERQEIFRFSNPLRHSELVAFYATQDDNESPALHFDTLSALIDWNAYLVGLAVHWRAVFY